MELRQQKKRLGEAVAWILETLDREVDEQDGQGQRKQSLESLAYVRDVLSGHINEIDERRLWGEAEFKRRWEVRETSPSVTTAKSGSPSPRDKRRSMVNSPIPPSVNETLRGFISSNATRAASAGPDHVRSSSGAAAVPRAASPQASARVSTNNPFHRVSGGNVLHGQWSVAANQTVIGNDGMPDVRSQVPVQHDPLGVLR